MCGQANVSAHAQLTASMWCLWSDKSHMTLSPRLSCFSHATLKSWVEPGEEAKHYTCILNFVIDCNCYHGDLKCYCPKHTTVGADMCVCACMAGQPTNILVTLCTYL